MSSRNGFGLKPPVQQPLDGLREANMSTLDYLQGQQAGATDALAGAAQRVGQWKRYSQGLEAKLEQASEGQVFANAQLSGAMALVKALGDELRRLSPNNALLDPATLDRIQRQGMAAALTRAGYNYDVTTNRVSKR
ncbi:chromosome segregation ATPase-like protein [Burkholderia pseudomallei]|nr:chromosome segregation ATPase-like protein [Burkholderia pseudomallei]